MWRLIASSVLVAFLSGCGNPDKSSRTDELKQRCAAGVASACSALEAVKSKSGP